MSDEVKLEPCPWCDPLKAKLIGKVTMMAFGNTPGVEHWHGLCTACGAEGPKEATREAGRAAWNRRPSDGKLREALEKTRNELYWCAEQLKARGLPGVPGDSVDVALAESAAALATERKE